MIHVFRPFRHVYTFKPYSYSSLLCKSRWTIIGINLGMCDDNLPEVYTSFRNAEVNRFVRSIAEPDYEYNICNKDPDEHSAIRAVS